MYSDLINSLKTREEVNNLTLEIDKLETLSISSKMSFDKAIEAISQTTSKKIIEIFKKFNLDFNDKELISDFLQTLKDLIKKFKVIKLILTFDPSLKTIENIHEFISQNLGTGYILDIEIDRSVLGGAVLMFNGKYKDFSLRKSLEEVFANKKEEIAKLLNC